MNRSPVSMDMIFDCLRLSYVLEGVCVTMRSTIVILAIMTLGLGFPTKVIVLIFKVIIVFVLS